MNQISSLALIILIFILFYKIKKNYHLGTIHHPDIVHINKGHESLPYKKRRYLMTRSEYFFYHRFLLPKYGDKYFIIPQVSLFALINVDKNEIKKRTYQYKINRLRVDYVIFSKPQFGPLLVIEYDDPSHLMWDRAERDRFVNSALEAADLPIIHITTNQYIDKQTEIEKNIDELLSKSN